ncbi:DUF3429 domain-containing protein [Falsiroseomonas oryzae]|uniref:DUF3429 domain-containing protein n=1 Tax=Falsiroseomonas oryzae TaxID=2766473 RepID=UPI0022EA5C0B|nr:DUF3429 domain-containing protein [Roseomonas sp. MO-31]
MDTPLPAPARLLGPAGLIPFVALALGTWAGWPGAAAAQVAYGATILAFLGAVHWGLALRAPASERRAEWPRLGLGVVPALIAWVALLLPVSFGLGLLALAIPAVAAVETSATRAGLMPSSYLRLRYLLSAGASASCAITLLGY